MRDGQVRAAGREVEKWLPVLREHKPEITRWLEGRQALEALAATLDHPIGDLLDWYADDVPEFAVMDTEQAEHVVRDYVANWRVYRGSGG
jgi:hypothetical protein